MRPPAISQLVNVTQSVMPTYLPTMTAPTTYQTMLSPASGTTVVSTAATYQQQQAAMLAALQLQQLSMYPSAFKHVVNMMWLCQQISVHSESLSGNPSTDFCIVFRIRIASFLLSDMFRACCCEIMS